MSDSDMMHGMLGRSFGARRRSYVLRTVRQYKGEEIPTQAHDCTATESCSYCRRVKREFIKAKKNQSPATGRIEP